MANAKKTDEAGEALPPFEQSLEKVQAIVDAIEGGQVPLEQSLEQYTAGMKLIRHCRTILDRAEQKIKQITVDEQGNLRESGEIADPED